MEDFSFFWLLRTSESESRLFSAPDESTEEASSVEEFLEIVMLSGRSNGALKLFLAFGPAEVRLTVTMEPPLSLRVSVFDSVESFLCMPRYARTSGGSGRDSLTGPSQPSPSPLRRGSSSLSSVEAADNGLLLPRRAS